MWKHSIVKEVPKNVTSFSVNKNAKQYATKILMSSQCFFFGDTTTNLLVDSLVANPSLFSGKNIVSLRLPYNVCLFEYILEDSFARRVASLVMQVSDEAISICPLCHIPATGWVFSPINYYVDTKNPGAMAKSKMKVKMTKKQYKDQEALDVHILGLTNISLILFECKNIIHETIEPDDIQNMKRKREGKLPLFEYKVLNVFSASSVRRKTKGQEVSMDHNRVHLCRGHFKEYTEDSPLFGKIVGKFWWQPQARGKGGGVVINKYNCDHKEDKNG